MTRSIKDGDITWVFLERENDQQCDLCGTVAELRPYGPNGESVCFDCGMKDEPAARRAFERLLTGESDTDVKGKEAT